MVFTEWMARAAEPGTSAYVANLTRAGQESGSCVHFRGQMNHESAGRFVHLTWEDVCLWITETPGLSELRQYLKTKTAGLSAAFPSI
jgi:hypothetical protein